MRKRLIKDSDDEDQADDDEMSDIWKTLFYDTL